MLTEPGSSLGSTSKSPRPWQETWREGYLPGNAVRRHLCRARIKRFDTIANQISINDERKAKYEFSTPYTISTGVVVTKADNSSINSFADLKGKTTAQSLTSNFYKMAVEAGANVQAVEGWAQSATLVQQGRVDATVNDKLTYLTTPRTPPTPV